jgi:hypothetical protein
MKTTNCYLVATLLAGGIVTLAPVSALAKPGSTNDSAGQHEAAQLIKNVEQKAFDLHEHAVTMQAADASRLSRSFFIDESNAIKEDVNALGKSIARLQTLEKSENPTDQALVERLRPELADIATTTTQEIHYLNDNPDRLWQPGYQKLATLLRDETAALSETVHDSESLQKLAAREHKLRNDLGHSSAVGQP